MPQAQVEDVRADEELALLCRALSNATRLRMLRLLAEKDRVCGDIVDLFNLSQSTISHHLKQLRECGLVLAEERGASTCYRVNRPRLKQVEALMHNLIAHSSNHN